MFDAIVKAKAFGNFFASRAVSYLDLLRIETEIQLNEFKVQIIGLIVMVIGTLFAIFFTFLALLITFWDTPYRLLIAWSIVAVYVGAGVVGYVLHHRRKITEPAFSLLRKEFNDDIELVKEMI